MRKRKELLTSDTGRWCVWHVTGLENRAELWRGRLLHLPSGRTHAVPSTAKEGVMTDIKIFGDHDDRTKEQMARCMQFGSVVGGVLCADGHLGYAQPVGGVIAYEEHISVSGVGFDIACGNMAVKLDLPKAAIADRIGPIVTAIRASVSFGLGRTNAAKVEHDLFDHP